MRIKFNKRNFVSVSIICFGVLFVALTTTTTLYYKGYRINYTPSLPVGIWQINKNFTKIKKGDHVWLTPTKQIADFGIQRGYLKKNTRCKNNSIPLIKTVYGLAGDTYSFENDLIKINKKPIEKIKRKGFDSQGRIMPTVPDGVVQENNLFVLTMHTHSFDSRYWGTIPINNVVGTARPVLIWK